MSTAASDIGSSLGKRERTQETPAAHSPTHRARLETKSKGEKDDRNSNVKKGKDRWRIHRVTEDYVNFVGDMMYPKTVFPSPGFDASKGRFPFERISTLGYLLNPMRRGLVVEKWSPFEIAVFEASMTLFGKNFHQVAKFIKTKTTKEVIEFYYFWKKTQHYKQYKKTFVFDERDNPEVFPK